MAIFKKSKKTEDAAVEPAEKPVKKAKATKAEAPKADARAPRTVSTLALRTIIAPLATEKTARLAGSNVYAFLVAKGANRVAVKQAIRELYKVTPVKVNIVNVRGTAKRFGRFTGRTQDTRKAYVTLPTGSHIDVFEAV
ncbi:50S ribosomal protein L23 [Candidatus Uhrbacteria bacterium]|nr:50S ribosomal protein L23 [Candidatus Uhrbacteria bacterium]